MAGIDFYNNIEHPERNFGGYVLSKVISWFNSLTAIGKAGVIIASIVGLSAVSAAPDDSFHVPTDKPAAAKEKKPAADVITNETVTETEVVPFGIRKQNDDTLAKGITKTLVEGMDGVLTVTYNVTYTNGVETSREKIKEETTKQPKTQIIAFGTYVKPAPKKTSSCDPNYSEGCVPIASDVDCGGGSGNGPSYVYGAVKVIGQDIYDLDSDGDGYGCE